DILIVVDMFLTGFDSRKLNTLYVDRNLKHHGLIQAYSRTNRVEKSTKPYGNIVCYRDLKEQTDEAIEIFSQTNQTDIVLSDSYETYLRAFQDVLQRVFRIAPTPEQVDNLEEEQDQKSFIMAYRELANVLMKLKTFVEFEFSERELGIGEQTFEDYKIKYLHLYDKVHRTPPEEGGDAPVSILDDIDFNIEVLRNDLINVEYIMNLLRELNLEDAGEMEKGKNQIRRLLDKADDDQLRLKADLIRQFLDEVVPSLHAGDDVDEAYYDFEDDQKEKETTAFAQNEAYPEELLKDIMHDYEYSGHLDRNKIDEGLSGGLLTRTKKLQKVKQFIQQTVQKFRMTA